MFIGVFNTSIGDDWQLFTALEQITYALLHKVREVPALKVDTLCKVVVSGMALQSFCEHLKVVREMLQLLNTVLRVTSETSENASKEFEVRHGSIQAAVSNG